jgi:ATP-binding cassette subfamily B protein
LISGITSKLDAVVSGVVMPIQSLVGSLVLICAVVAALIVVDPVVSIVAIVGFSGCYLLITILFRKKLLHNSRLVAREQTQVVKYLQEAMGGIRDILLDGSQPYFLQAYGHADRQFRYGRGNNLFISGSPRFVLESLGMALIAALAYAMSFQADGFTARLPVLAALVIGGQRLLPAMQQAYAAWTGILGSQAQLAEVVGLISQPMPEWTGGQHPPPLEVSESIRFEEVSFRYSSDGPLVLDRVNLQIQSGTTVGIVGETGSGKSTALDLLMGFLEPSLGSVLVDGKSVSGVRRRSWQRNIAHVPQMIFLADASFAENIAFGVPGEEIDMGRVREAAGLAAVADFIESSPEGYRASVGERGIRLSGGQRQRIGIARALYKRAKVLVLDEATSALDHSTELLVMESLRRKGGEITVVVVAHRPTTLVNCDRIYRVEDGLLSEVGVNGGAGEHC